MSRSIVRIVLCLIFGLAISSQVLADHDDGYGNENLPVGGEYRIGGNSVLDTSGTQNLFLGVGAAQRGRYTTAVGYYSGHSLGKNIRYNTLIGLGAGQNITTGEYNTCLGSTSGYYNQTGQYNTYLGVNAGLNSTVSYNTFVGHNAGLADTVGTQNTFLGYRAGGGNTTGNNNVYLGSSAGYYGPGGSDNVIIGNASTLIQTSGAQNVNIGSMSAYCASGATYGGIGNINIGFCAGRGIDGTANNPMYNTNVGWKAGFGNNSGYNVFLGVNAGYGCTSTASVGLGSYAKPTDNHQAVIGGDDTNGYIDNVYFGRGVRSATPSTTVTLQATGGLSGNVSGSDLLLKGGVKSGTGKDGIVKVAGNFKVSGNMTLPSATGVLSVANKIDAKEGEFDVLHIKGGADLTEMFDVRTVPTGNNEMADLLRAQGAQ